MAGFVVFLGIARSIVKTFNPLNKNRNETSQPIAESIQLCPPPPPQPQPQMPVAMKPSSRADQRELESISCSTIDIVKGDTLWSLSRKYGVSIDAIKEANGLIGDTINAEL